MCTVCAYTCGYTAHTHVHMHTLTPTGHPCAGINEKADRGLSGQRLTQGHTASKVSGHERRTYVFIPDLDSCFRHVHMCCTRGRVRIKTALCLTQHAPCLRVLTGVLKQNQALVQVEMAVQATLTWAIQEPSRTFPGWLYFPRDPCVPA